MLANKESLSIFFVQLLTSEEVFCCINIPSLTINQDFSALGTVDNQTTDFLLEAARTHDQLTQYTFCSIIGTTTESFDFWEQCHLPIWSGGFGFTKLEDISPAAFLSSWSNSSQQLPARFPGLNDYCSSLIQQIPQLDTI